MASGAKLPQWAERARRKWSNTGTRRPHFAETPGPGQESVWDYPRPPAILADERLVRVELGGVVIAESRRSSKVLETSHPPGFYIPRADVDMGLLQRAGGGSRCEWKGEATYWDVEAGGKHVRGRAWSYETPFAAAAAIAGHLSFYPSHFACFVDGTRVRPQPGRFYGAWITPEAVGPFKGEAGTADW